MSSAHHTPLDIVILGLSITSSWGNGHATTWRGLVRELVAQGHRVHFLERDVPWYASHRDLPAPPWCRTTLYGSLEELRDAHTRTLREADVVIVGSYVPDGVEVGNLVLDEARGTVAFYDIDTPVTLSKLRCSDFEYLHPAQIGRYDLYLSFTGGPLLGALERDWGARRARALYCSVDPDAGYAFDERVERRWDLGYLGTWSDDRQVRVESLLNAPACQMPEARFVVAGPQYPDDLVWPSNVARIDHIAPPDHAAFYNAQRFTLNVTRDAMIATGWAPSVRLFEAAACGVPIISDVWAGIEDVLLPGEEILLARSTGDVLRYLREMPDKERRTIGARARARVLGSHTAAHRAAQLVDEVLAATPTRSTMPLSTALTPPSPASPGA